MKALRLLFFALILSFGANAQVIINEVCYDPSNNNLDGDTNGDGVYDQTQDEFIEMVNVGTTAIDISGYQILDVVIATNLRTVRHTIANGTILNPGAAVVVFGGGTAVGTFGGATVFIDRGTAGLSMGNTGEKVLVTDANGVGVDSLDTDALSDNPNESYTRNPDLTGDYVQHNRARAGVLFSPGTRIDGSPFQVTSLGAVKVPDLRVYPNPANQRLFALIDDIEAPLVEVIDLKGQVVLKEIVPTNGVDIQNLSAGIYTVRVLNAPKPITRRIVVNH